METQEQFEQWAVVELFGHSQIAGLVSSQTIGGDSFIRVDVPDDEGEGWRFTKLLGKGAIYAMTFCSEEAGRIAARRLDIRPVTEWTVPDAKRALPGPDERLLASENQVGGCGGEWERGYDPRGLCE
jgi:hypothetical protein